jgi:hypothetical protein
VGFWRWEKKKSGQKKKTGPCCDMYGDSKIFFVQLLSI